MSDTCTFAEFLDHCTGRKVMPPPAQAKKRPSCPPESEEQKALFDWWKRTPYARHFVMYHIPNGGRRDKITGARLKAEGVVAGVPDVFLAYLKEHCAEAFSRYYDEDGSLRDAFKSPDDIASEYNRDVGFYEKSLLDKTYIEHYDYRRTPIADWDGPQRRGSAEDE